jgi:hypothetical protein
MSLPVLTTFRQLAIVLVLLLLQAPAWAKHNSEHPLSDAEWQEVTEKVALLEASVFVPSLLPTIMRHRDALRLSAAQVAAMRRWRREHYVEMVNLMNEIIEKKVQFRVESLSPEVSDEHLVAFQAHIHRLQQRLLRIRLSCRRLIMTTFTAEQWENFEFVVSNEPKLASLFPQTHDIPRDHRH